MHGLGNDFVIVDARREAFALTPETARAITDRREGIGCDQLIVLEPPVDSAAEVFMRIRNADGGEVEACGNAARCVTALIVDERGNGAAQEPVVIETPAGLIKGTLDGPRRATVDMGAVGQDWREIPLAKACDTLHLDLSHGPLSDPVAVSIGNPHMVFFVADSTAEPLDELGAVLEHHPMFPERANVSLVTLAGENRLRQRVWERGVGITRACGTGACAAAVAAARRGLTGRQVAVELDGGLLEIEWREDNHVFMTGPVATAFTGTFTA